MIQSNIKKLKNKTNYNDIICLRAMAKFSRMALILADQSISAQEERVDATNNTVEIAYANTYKNSLNQDLSWHLEHVGIKAGKMVYHMLNISLPKVSHDATDQINLMSTGRYSWQNRAAFALSNSRTKNDVPHLVLNMAGTGSGKTRMNLRAICALNEDKPVRVATALNLRTLTLQTADAYQQQLEIGKDEMACVIGDDLAKKLHASGNENVDEDESEYSLDVLSEFDFDLPDWIQFYSKKNPKLADIIGAPILVSTIDFLIAAGEPHRKHHHILAAIRVMHSDLILDEIDGYEPKALLAVLRLVTASAMFGKNVVASSATLSKPVAKMLWQAYQHGAEMRGLLYKEPTLFKTAIIDDLIKPSVAAHENVDIFMEKYISHVDDMMLKLKGVCYRKPVLAAIDQKDEHVWLSTINKWAKSLHKNHAWVDNVTGKNLSIGLVRIANVTTAVKVAKHLAKTIPESKVVCYHSNHFPMQRFHIEKRLDFLLSRKKSPYAHILADKEIRQILDRAKSDVQFIVVATPVEEIGRDHDFDWSIIEPSSAQSIVQTAGRVNRHRLELVKNPNIALLQYCYNEIKGKEVVFTKPGLETIFGNKSTHNSHDLNNLFDWKGLEQIDARMRFCSDTHAFAKFDDEAIEKNTQEIFNSMLTCNHLWMAKETYTESSLRSLEPSIELRLDDPDYAENYKVRSENDNDGEEEDSTIYDLLPRDPNDWLCKEDSALIADAEELNVDNKKAMTVSISYYSQDQKDKKTSLFVREEICRHKSFGFYRRSKK